MEELFLEYLRMRKQNIPVKEILKALNPYVAKLDKENRELLSRKIRAWENQKMDMNYDNPDTKAVPDEINSLGKKASNAALDPESWIECPKCGKKNRFEEYFCFKCGYLLGGFGDKLDTKVFAPATKELFSPDYFGEESLLIVHAKGVENTLELRPANFMHDIIFGRSDSQSEMKPDIDLNAINGRELGVSRLHLALTYASDNHALEIYDLGSANGTRLNNVKLRPNEKRVLRHGDELRLGRCILTIAYAHPGMPIE